MNPNDVNDVSSVLRRAQNLYTPFTTGMFARRLPRAFNATVFQIHPRFTFPLSMITTRHQTNAADAFLDPSVFSIRTPEEIAKLAEENKNQNQNQKTQAEKSTESTKADGEQEELARTGRAWRASELRLKSFDDLHTLWFVLIRERTRLLTTKSMLKGETRKAQVEASTNAALNLRKVRKSMARIKVVLGERKRLMKEYKLATGAIEPPALREKETAAQRVWRKRVKKYGRVDPIGTLGTPLRSNNLQ